MQYTCTRKCTRAHTQTHTHRQTLAQMLHRRSPSQPRTLPLCCCQIKAGRAGHKGECKAAARADTRTAAKPTAADVERFLCSSLIAAQFTNFLWRFPSTCRSSAKPSPGGCKKAPRPSYTAASAGPGRSGMRRQWSLCLLCAHCAHFLRRKTCCALFANDRGSCVHILCSATTASRPAWTSRRACRGRGRFSGAADAGGTSTPRSVGWRASRRRGSSWRCA